MSRSLSNFRNTFVSRRVRALARTATACLCVLLVSHAGTPAFADSYPQVPPQAASPQTVAQPLSRDQLNNLVAPVALYPDELLGQILAASTYPLEIVEAAQWLEQNGNLQDQALIDAAKSRIGIRVFSYSLGFRMWLSLLNRDIRWTTDLGNAFLAQQADVMNAVQVMRLRAKNNGRLTTTPQQVVSTEAQNGQYAVRIEPANPQVIYPPVYNPAYVWGPPPAGVYPPVSSYSSGASYDSCGYGGGYGFDAGINIASLFSGLVSFASWGWSLGWFSHSLSLASLFFNILGFHGFGGGGYGAAMALWSHNPAHRLGVAYPRGFSAPRSASMVAGARPGSLSGNRAGSDWQRFNAPSTPAYRADMTRAGMTRSGMAPNQPQSWSQRSFAQHQQQRYSEQSMGSSRYSEPRYSEPRYSQPKMSAPHYSAPKYSAPKFSAPKHSGGGGHSGKSSHKR